ncbi:MAG: NAD(P)H-hydrate dehydratase [Clostridia bacterium]|nr:NAD(P)H-hydrate dehydratase [Clostridia bacterium]
MCDKLDRAAAAALLPLRDETGAKWRFGRTLLVCGSRDFSGAALLACESALRSGAGLVQLASVDAVIGSARSRLPEALLLPLPESGDGKGVISESGAFALLRAAERAQSLLFGCGLGISDDGRSLLRLLAEDFIGPMVVDADGLNLLAEDPSFLSRRPGRTILTPHAGEFSRLTGLARDASEAEARDAATAFAKDFGVTLALKGAQTLVTDGTRSLLLGAPNSGLAKGGSGDVLAGLAAGLASQMPQDPFTAAALAVFVHAEAGKLARTALGARGMLPSDVIARLPQAFLSLEAGQA